MPPLRMDVIRDYIGSSADDKIAIIRIFIQTIAFISPALFITNSLLESGVLYYNIPAPAIATGAALTLIVNRAIYRIHSSDPDAHDESLYQKTHKKFGNAGVWFLRITGFIYYQSYTAALITIISLTAVNSSPGNDTGLYIGLILTLYMTIYAMSRLSPESFQKVCTFVSVASICVAIPLLLYTWVLKTQGIPLIQDELVELNHSFNAEIAQGLLATMGFEWMWRVDSPHSQHQAKVIYTGSNIAVIVSTFLYLISFATLFSQRFVLSLPQLIFNVSVAMTLPIGVLSCGCAFIKSGDLLNKDADKFRYIELLFIAMLTLIAALFNDFLPVLGGISVLSAMLFFFSIALSDRQDFLSWLGAVFILVVAIFCLYDINHILILHP